jgi:hypothetical protein
MLREAIDLVGEGRMSNKATAGFISIAEMEIGSVFIGGIGILPFPTNCAIVSLIAK